VSLVIAPRLVGGEAENVQYQRGVRDVGADGRGVGGGDPPLWPGVTTITGSSSNGSRKAIAKSRLHVARGPSP
jgi:hypothetical protein